MFQSSSFAVVGEAETREQLQDSLKANPADVILTNFRLAGKSVLDVVDELRTATTAGILFYSGSENPVDRARACAVQAGGFVSWSASRERLLESLQAIAEGRQLWTGSERRRLTAHLRSDAICDGDFAPLTPRENDVVKRVVEGETNKQIADMFGISSETVKEHLQNAMHKVGLTDRTQLAVWAVRNGFA